MQEHGYDVMVLGTGAAGWTAALRAAAGGARVGLFEKADTVGGTSAWSGGTVWLPNNRHEAELGFSDSRAEVLTYLMSLSHGLMEQPLVEAYVDTAPEVAAWLEDNSPVEFETLRGNAFHVVDVPRFAYVNHPAWLVFDQHYLSRYGLAGHRPPAPTPDWIIEAPAIAELATQIGVPAVALQATIERWNGNVAAGSDLDFRRGESHHDRAWGDPAFGGTRQGTLGPVDTPPYYAVRVRCGALGTKGGPRTDTQGCVLDVDGDVIEGLYAAGNAMGSVMGMTYGGHGGTLGPGLVFGYLSGRHAALAAAGLS